MRPLLSLIRREFTAYFLSPFGYVVAFALLFILGVQFNSTLGLMTEVGSKGTEYPFQTMFGDVKFWLIFLLIPPTLTMRLLAGAMFLAIGLFVSSLVKSQIVSALITLIVSLAFVSAAFVRPSYDTVSSAKLLAYFISVPEHFRLSWCRGVIDSRNVILYVTVTLFCLYLTVRSLEARRR